MRVLLDENLPHDLIAELTGHDVLTVRGLGWAGGPEVAHREQFLEEYTTEGRERFFSSHLIQDGVIRNLQTLAEYSSRSRITSAWSRRAQRSVRSCRRGARLKGTVDTRIRASVGSCGRAVGEQHEHRAQSRTYRLHYFTRQLHTNDGRSSGFGATAGDWTLGHDHRRLEPASDRLGAVYGFLPPNEDVAKKAGEWQTFDITLVGRLVTVVLSGKAVISSQEIPGITGGALDSAEGTPGPLMLQGDHGPIEFRNIVLTPAK